MPTTVQKITRRGFRAAPADVRRRANDAVADFMVATASSRVLAELRPATYCGPGSAGDRGAYMLSLHGDDRFDLSTIEAGS
jgi:hypothetical protein